MENGARVEDVDNEKISSYISSEETYFRQEPKTSRNDPCPCGSGKKV